MSVIVAKDKTYLTHVDEGGVKRVIPISCLIRDHTTHPDAHPEDSGGKLYPQFYQPQPFPVGTWRVTFIERSDDPYTAPVMIGTDAHQLVVCLDGSIVEDWGYMIHHSVSPTTWGCLNTLAEEDQVWLASIVRLREEVVVL